MLNVYSQPDCPHCDRVKAQLTAEMIPFNEINVREDDEALHKVTQEWGYQQVPVVEKDGHHILNPNPNKLEEFIYGGSAPSVFDEE